MNGQKDCASYSHYCSSVFGVGVTWQILPLFISKMIFALQKRNKTWPLAWPELKNCFRTRNCGLARPIKLMPHICHPMPHASMQGFTQHTDPLNWKNFGDYSLVCRLNTWMYRASIQTYWLISVGLSMHGEFSGIHASIKWKRKYRFVGSMFCTIILHTCRWCLGGLLITSYVLSSRFNMIK